MSTTRPRRGAHPGRRPRLLVLTTHGMTLRLLARGQLRHLAEERGWDVSAACAPGADLEGAARQEEVEVTPIPALRREISPAADLAALWQLHRLIRRLRPDLVVAGTPKAGFLGVLAARLARVPRVVYVLRGLRLGMARLFHKVDMELESPDYELKTKMAPTPGPANSFKVRVKGYRN